jgi:hypothetical protein
MSEQLITDQIPTGDQEDTVETATIPEIVPGSENSAEEILPTDPGDAPPTEAVDPDEGKTELEKMIARRTGFWQVKMEAADAKWIKNACQGKFEVTGPNEAFMLMNCFLGFSSAVARQEAEKQTDTIVVQAAAIEACAFFINRHTCSGLEAAQRLFRIAMNMNNVMMKLRSLDEQINMLREMEKANAKPDHNPDTTPQTMEAPAEKEE